MNQFLKLVEIRSQNPMTNLDPMCYYGDYRSLRGTKVLTPAWGSTNRLCGRQQYKKTKGDPKAARAAITTRFLAVTGGIIAHRTIEHTDSRFLTILAQSEQAWTRHLHQSAILIAANRIRHDTSSTQSLNTQSNRRAKQSFSGASHAQKSVVGASFWRKGIVQTWQPLQNGLQWYWSNQLVVNSSNPGGGLARLKTLRKRIKKFT